MMSLVRHTKRPCWGNIIIIYRNVDHQSGFTFWPNTKVVCISHDNYAVLYLPRKVWTPNSTYCEQKYKLKGANKTYNIKQQHDRGNSLQLCRLVEVMNYRAFNCTTRLVDILSCLQFRRIPTLLDNPILHIYLHVRNHWS